MTSISLWLLLIDIASNLSITIHLLSIVTLIAVPVIFIGIAMTNDVRNYGDKKKVSYSEWWKKLKFPFILSICMLILVQFIPSPRTMYVILGIETIDTVVTNDENQKLLNMLRDKVEEYLTPEEK